MKKFKLTKSTKDNKKLEIIINQLMRRSKKNVTFAIPPIPLSFYSHSLGVDETFNYFNTMPSKINELFFFCDAIEKVKTIDIEFVVINDIEKKSHLFNIKPEVVVQENREIKLNPGDKIIIKHKHIDNIKNIWIGFALYIDKTNFDYTQMLIKELENNTEEFNFEE